MKARVTDDPPPPHFSFSAITDWESAQFLTGSSPSIPRRRARPISSVRYSFFCLPSILAPVGKKNHPFPHEGTSLFSPFPRYPIVIASAPTSLLLTIPTCAIHIGSSRSSYSSRPPQEKKSLKGELHRLVLHIALSRKKG